MAQAPRDQNSVPTLLGVSSTDGVTPVVVYANPTTHRLLIDNAGGGGSAPVGGTNAIQVYATSTTLGGDNTKASLDPSTGNMVTSGSITGTNYSLTPDVGSGSHATFGSVTFGGGGKIYSDSSAPFLVPWAINGSTGSAWFGGFNSMIIDSSGNVTAPSYKTTSGTAAQILAANGTVITAGTNITISGGTIAASGGSGTVTAVSVATANGFSGTSSGGATPALTLNVDGTHYLPTTTDQTNWNAKGTGTVTAVSVATANGVSGTSSGGATPALTISLGAITPSTVNKVTITAPTTSATLTIADGKTATHNSSTTFAGVDGKTLTINNSLTFAGTDATTITFQGTDTYVGRGTTDTLTNKTLTTPTIGSFTNATHNHQAAAGGGTLAEAALALTDITTNNVTTSAHGFTPKAPNDATKFLRGDATWAVPAGVPTVTSITPLCDSVSVIESNVTVGSTTKMYVGRVVIPFNITVNQLSWVMAGFRTSNQAYKCAVFTEDGQTKKIEVTTASIASNITVSTAVSAVALTAGIYYFAFLPQGSGAADIRTQQGGADIMSPSGKPITVGYLTVTSTVIPSTITPSAITVEGGDCPYFRLDN